MKADKVFKNLNKSQILKSVFHKQCNNDNSRENEMQHKVKLEVEELFMGKKGVGFTFYMT